MRIYLRIHPKSIAVGSHCFFLCFVFVGFWFVLVCGWRSRVQAGGERVEITVWQKWSNGVGWLAG